MNIRKLWERLLESEEERRERQRLEELNEIHTTLERGLFVTFNESASHDAEVAAIRSLPHVERAAMAFNQTAIVYADSHEHLDQVAESIRGRGTVAGIMKLLPEPVPPGQ